MDMEFKYGQMVLDTRESGPKTKPMERVNSGTQMEISMKVIGKMIRQMVMEFTFM